MKHTHGLRILSAAFICIIIAANGIFMPGCSAEATRTKARQIYDLGTKAQTAATKIRDALTKYNAGLIEESVFVDMILAWLPEDKAAVFQGWISIGTDVRVAAEDIVLALEATAQKSFDESATLDAQADASEDRWANFIQIVQSGASIALQPEGVVIGGLSAILALVNRKRKQEQVRADVNMATAQKANTNTARMREIATALVGTTEAFKSTPGGQAEWPAIRRVVARTHSQDVRDFVASTKPTLDIADRPVPSERASAARGSAERTTVPLEGAISFGAPNTPPPPGPEDYNKDGSAK